eukprot:363982-Chlamydomonas_euryale.AAC.6
MRRCSCADVVGTAALATAGAPRQCAWLDLGPATDCTWLDPGPATECTRLRRRARAAGRRGFATVLYVRHGQKKRRRARGGGVRPAAHGRPRPCTSAHAAADLLLAMLAHARQTPCEHERLSHTVGRQGAAPPMPRVRSPACCALRACRRSRRRRDLLPPTAMTRRCWQRRWLCKCTAGRATGRATVRRWHEPLGCPRGAGGRGGSHARSARCGAARDEPRGVTTAWDEKSGRPPGRRVAEPRRPPLRARRAAHARMRWGCAVRRPVHTQMCGTVAGNAFRLPAVSNPRNDRRRRRARPSQHGVAGHSQESSPPQTHTRNHIRRARRSLQRGSALQATLPPLLASLEVEGRHRPNR